MSTPYRTRMYPSVEEMHGGGEAIAAGMDFGGLGHHDERVYCAVGKDSNENKQNLAWVVKNFPRKKICLVHVMQPLSQATSSVGRSGPMLHRQRQAMKEVLKSYLVILQTAGVEGEEVHIEKGRIWEGIVDLISLHKIKRLVIGAAADKYYRKNMTDIKSKTAKYVHEKAPSSCYIWFICKGHLIETKEAEGVLNEYDSIIPVNSRYSNDGRTMSDVSSVDGTLDSPQSSTHYDRNGMFGSTSSQSFFVSTSEVPSAPAFDLFPVMEQLAFLSFDMENHGDRINATSQSSGEIIRNSSPTKALEITLGEEMYEKLKQAMAEAENSKREAFEESLRRQKAETDAIEASRWATAAEKMYNDERNLRKDIENLASREKIEKSLIEDEMAVYKNMTQVMKEEMLSAVELVERYKKEGVDMEVKLDQALRAAEELKQQVDCLKLKASRNLPQYFSEFSSSDIEDSTNQFHPSLKIGEGRNGRIYKGVVRYTKVAIKVLHASNQERSSEYQKEVEVMSTLRHPNIVTLIGVCPESFTLIYEYLPNGNLEDRLSCKNNSSPLPWQTRIRIAAELCSALVFLHSSKPPCIVHGNLKPSNILLDDTFISKVSGFGDCRAIAPDRQTSISQAAGSSKTQPNSSSNSAPAGSVLMRMLNDTSGYSDPFITPGELSKQNDIYSFGIILLRLLTGKKAWGITREVQRALDSKTFDRLLDCSAGDWPGVEAQQLAYLALRCAGNIENRPDLATEVLSALELMYDWCRASSKNFQLGDEEPRETPPYFICPIQQDVMQDPHVAADGYTYEREAIRGWLDNGHNTSPMTNLQLAHTNLVPNLALRSAIQESLYHL